MGEDFNLRARLKGPGNAQSDQQVRCGDDGSLVELTRYMELAMRGLLYAATVTAVTLPVNAATLASKFALYNPPGSGVLLDLVDVEAHYVLATTVVNALGIYFSNGTNATGATFTTAGVIQNARLGEGRASAATFWAAATHVGTPVLVDIVGGWGAVTDGGATPVRKEFNGKILIPPSTLVSLAMTTAAATGSSVTASIRWAEVPYVSP